MYQGACILGRGGEEDAVLSLIYSFFAGSYKISVDKASMTTAADALFRAGIKYRGTEAGDGEWCSFYVDSSDMKAVRSLFGSNGIEADYSDIRGFPLLLRFLRRRPGISAGVIAFAAIMWISGRVIWDFTFEGNENVPDGEIMEMLSELGCDYGAYIPDIDFDSLQAFFLAKSKNVAWLSVNMRGNRAFVEVSEISHGNTKDLSGKYANIVASEDGQVTLVLPSNGEAAVESGAVVKKGDILISGVVHARDAVLEDKVRYEYAAGEVMAYVNRSVSVKVPFENERKVYTGESYEEKRVKIFKKNINLFSKGRIKYTTYDKIEENEQLCLLGIIPLPVWIEKTTYREYENVPLTLDSGEAMDAAFSELRDRMDEELSNCELVSKRIVTVPEDDGFVIRCDMVCLSNIAEVREFSADPESNSNQ